MANQPRSQGAFRWLWRWGGALGMRLMANRGKCHICLVIYTPFGLFFGMQIWYLPSLPYIYSSVSLYFCYKFARSKFVQIHFFV